MNSFHFFDTASTTCCCPSAARLVEEFSTTHFGNPSSAHAMGRRAQEAIATARKFLADHFGVKPEQVIFTGSGSESDNLAVHGVAMHRLGLSLKSGRPDPVHVMCSSTEHAAVRKTVVSLEFYGIQSDFIPVDKEGRVDPVRTAAMVRPETCFVSVHHVNNVLGTIQDVEGIARAVKAKNPRTIFHSDCVQAFGKIPSPRAGSAVDLVSISAHKIGGPKGVGALIVLNPTLLKDGFRPLIWGGDQEGGLRSGTQNPGLIAGLGEAARITLEKREATQAHYQRLRHALHQGLQGASALKWISPEHAVPYVVSLCTPGIPGAMIAQELEQLGYLVSTGSACSSKKMEPDAVLQAIGLAPAEMMGALRVSFSPDHTVAEVEGLARAMVQVTEKFRGLLGAAS